MEDYVEPREGGWYVAGTRISLDSVVTEYQRGASPEGILRSFPLIGTLESVYGAITYYLAHKREVDIYLEAQRTFCEKMRSEQSLPPDLKLRLEQARRGLSFRSR
jgi:uncharacterized protein (DUF433 family)